MVTKVSEKHSTSIFWAETKFNNVETLLSCSQEQQDSPTSQNSIKTGSNSVSTIVKPWMLHTLPFPAKRPSEILCNAAKAVVSSSPVCLYK